MNKGKRKHVFIGTMLYGTPRRFQVYLQNFNASFLWKLTRQSSLYEQSVTEYFKVAKYNTFCPSNNILSEMCTLISCFLPISYTVHMFWEVVTISLLEKYNTLYIKCRLGRNGYSSSETSGTYMPDSPNKKIAMSLLTAVNVAATNNSNSV
jgi:hypothetical protein